jgi:ATP-dependent helicase HrpA
VAAQHQPATYEQLHLSMLAGLLGNVGCKLDDEDVYLGARGIKFYRHPGAHLAKKPGRWILAAELVETTRLFGRGIANIEPQWIEQVAGHLLKKQLLDPHWEKKAAEVTALERATLYGIVVYSGRRVNYSEGGPAGAREIFIREALVAGQWETALPFLAANQKLIKQVEDLEHKARRQDVLVDDELIYAFYDQQLPADVCSGYSCEQLVPRGSAQAAQPAGAHPRRTDAPRGGRHHHRRVSAQGAPGRRGLPAATYLHEPGDPRDGLTVTVPLFVLNQVNDERCEWLVPGMLKDKMLALLKSLHQKPRSRFVPLPDNAARITGSWMRPSPSARAA